MITLVKLIIAFSVSLLGDSITTYEPTEANTSPSPVYASVITSSNTPKEKAFQILENKCNVCHAKRNRRRVFTPENMNPWANDVYKQVFLKKRMPKGKNIKLTNTEYQELLTWITSIKIDENGNQL